MHHTKLFSELEERASFRLHSKANAGFRRRNARPLQMGGQNPREKRRKYKLKQLNQTHFLSFDCQFTVTVGGWRLQDDPGVHGGLPKQAAQVQVRPRAFPPERVPLWHRLPEHLERG